MNQSSKLIGAILFAFVIYITMRGQLPLYLALFSKSGSQPQSTSLKQSATMEVFGQSSEILNILPSKVADRMNEVLLNMGFG